MKTIIVATDFSKLSGFALSEATKLAELMHAKILLVFVQNTTDIRYALGQEIPLNFENSAQLRKQLATHVKEKFDELIQKYSRGYPEIETLTLRGIPSQEISMVARDRKADLIVAGSRGLSPLKTFFVGSTAQNLILASPCPVVVVSNPKKEDRKKAVV